MNFIMVPDDLLKNTAIKQSDCLVMGSLVSKAVLDKTDTIEISYSQINKRLPTLGIATIKRSIARLIEMRYIFVVRSGKRKNKYKINPDYLPTQKDRKQIKQTLNEDTATTTIDDYKGVINKFLQ